MIVASAGGVLISTGAALPWMSLFAGLRSYSGLVGVYGRVLFAGGVLAVVGGMAMALWRDPWLRRAVGFLGVAQTLFIVWLLAGLRSTIGDLGRHATLVARPGPGLFVALGGAMLVAAVLVVERREVPVAFTGRVYSACVKAWRM